MYLGFNYDFARGMQDELLRWAEEQRKIKRVRAAQPLEDLLPRSAPGVARQADEEMAGEELVEERRAS